MAFTEFNTIQWDTRGLNPAQISETLKKYVPFVDAITLQELSGKFEHHSNDAVEIAEKLGLNFQYRPAGDSEINPNQKYGIAILSPHTLWYPDLALVDHNEPNPIAQSHLVGRLKAMLVSDRLPRITVVSALVDAGSLFGVERDYKELRTLMLQVKHSLQPEPNDSKNYLVQGNFNCLVHSLRDLQLPQSQMLPLLAGVHITNDTHPKGKSVDHILYNAWRQNTQVGLEHVETACIKTQGEYPLVVSSFMVEVPEQHASPILISTNQVQSASMHLRPSMPHRSPEGQSE